MLAWLPPPPAYSSPPAYPKPATAPHDDNYQPIHIAKRQLLHTESENATETPRDTNIDHRDNFELFATVVGVIGGVTLITGFSAFCYSLFKKQKERADRANEQEANRRTTEGRFLHNLFEYKQKFHMGPSGSMATVEPIQLVPERAETEFSLTAPRCEAQTDQETRTVLFDDAVQVVIGEDAKKLEQILTDHPDLIHQTDSNGDTLLHHARDTAIARLLLRRGAKLNSANNAGLTPIHLIASEHNQTLLTLLLDWMEVISFDDASALFHTAINSRNLVLLRYLVRRGMHRNLHFERRFFSSMRTEQQTVQNSSGGTLLHEAVTANSLEIVIYILETGLVDVNATDDHGNTPLHLAMFPTMVALLNPLRSLL